MKKINVKGTITTNDDKWIYDWIGWDSVCPKDIDKQLQDADGDEVTFIINSGGGDVAAGNDIAYAISQYPAKTVADISGFCGSAASIIACSAKRARAYPSSMYMIHNVSSGARGDYKAMDKQSQILQTANKAISNVYQQKTGLSEKELLKLMDNESWFDAEEAKEKGFIDEIIGQQNDVTTSFSINNAFGNILPDDAKQKIRDLVGKGCRNPTQQQGTEDGNASNVNDSEMLFAKAQLQLLRMKGETR